MVNYLLFMLVVSLPREAILLFEGLAHPLRVLYAISLALVRPTVAIPAYFVLQSEKFFKGVQDLLERLSLLTMFYLFFDFVGLVVILICNV